LRRHCHYFLNIFFPKFLGIFPFLKGVGLCFLILCFSVGPALAELVLGKVTEEKLKSFSAYFERYTPSGIGGFSDARMEEKVMEEARSVYRWVSDRENWADQNEPRSPAMIHLARLYASFHRLGIEESLSKALDYLRRVESEGEMTAETYRGLALAYFHLGRGYFLEAARAGERAIELDPEKSRQEGMHRLGARAFYEAGYFREAYLHAQEQAVSYPEDSESSDLAYVLKTLVDQWGYVPDRVRFRVDENGNRIPEPVR